MFGNHLIERRMKEFEMKKNSSVSEGVSKSVPAEERFKQIEAVPNINNIIGEATHKIGKWLAPLKVSIYFDNFVL